MPTEHEVYPHAPLALVTAQVNFAYEPRLNDAATRDEFAGKIRRRLPILAEETISGFAINFGGEQAQQAPQQLPQQKQIRATNEQRTVSAVLNNQSITVEATEYVHFEGFAATLRECFTALVETIGSLYVGRAGLRYIDEIRSPGIEATANWAGWLSDALIAPVTLLPKRGLAGINGIAVFSVTEHVNIVVRWGEMQGSTIIAPNAAVRLPPHPAGRFFVLDADAFWQPESPEMVGIEELLDKFNVLHEPVSEVFEASITPRLKSLFRGESVDA